jgi:hypothetical protein
MKKSLVSILILLWIVVCLFFAKGIYDNQQSSRNINEPRIKPKPKSEKVTEEFHYEFNNGDIIFQTSLSPQSQAIQLATKSEYSHCGIIFNEGHPFVFEATQPVKMTRLEDWIARGKNGKYIVKRLKDSTIFQQNPDAYIKFCDACNSFNKKNYDFEFNWSDEKVYCSELVWKAYNRTLGIELGKLQSLSEFDLSDKIVKRKLKERYGNNIPMNEKVISPKAIFNSELLKTVVAHKITPAANTR